MKNKLRLTLSLLAALMLLYALPYSANAQDTDGDGMPAAWEAAHACLIGNTEDGAKAAKIYKSINQFWKNYY